MSQVIMTTELRDKLVAQYEIAKTGVSNCSNKNDAINLCNQLKVASGVCHASRILFDISVYDCDWVHSKCNNEWDWHKSPRDCTAIAEIISALQTRIDILKTFPN